MTTPASQPQSARPWTDQPEFPGPVLGIETSCDETAVGIVEGGRLLAMRFSTQVPLHQRFGGVVPEVASRNHLLSVLPTLQAALDDAGLTMRQLSGIAVTDRPGLLGALLVGVQTAATLAWRNGLPLVGVHHIHAHCWAAMLQMDGERTDGERPALPALALAVSGGHSSVLRIDGPDAFTTLGETLDDAAGEAFDKVGKLLGLPYPAGPHIDRLARDGDPRRWALPRGMRGRDDLAMSFSGLKTAARQQIELLRAELGIGPLDPLPERDLADVCASLQDAIVAQLVTTTLRAVDQTGLKQVVLAGGVAANSHLRATLATALTSVGARLVAVPPRLCTDNGAMVAALGSSLLALGHRADPLLMDAAPTARPPMRSLQKAT